MAKNGKVDPCSANHTNCNITYFLIKFSGYIAYEMQFNILYGFIRLFIYEYLIFTFISGVFFAKFPKYREKWRKHSFLVGTSGASCWRYVRNLVIIGVKIRASKIKGSGFDVSL